MRLQNWLKCGLLKPAEGPGHAVHPPTQPLEEADSNISAVVGLELCVEGGDVVATLQVAPEAGGSAGGSSDGPPAVEASDVDSGSNGGHHRSEHHEKEYDEAWMVQAGLFTNRPSLADKGAGMRQGAGSEMH